MTIDPSIPLSYRPPPIDAFGAFEQGQQVRARHMANEQTALQGDMLRTVYADQMIARAARQGAQSAEAWDAAFGELAQTLPQAERFIGKWSPFAADELAGSIAAAPVEGAKAQRAAGAGSIGGIGDAIASIGGGAGKGKGDSNIAQPTGPQVDLSTLTPQQRADEFRKLRRGMDALRKVRTVQDFDAAVESLAPEMPGIMKLKGVFNDLNFAEGVQLMHTRLAGLYQQLAPLVMAEAAGAPVREAQPGYAVEHTEAGPVLTTSPVGDGKPSFEFGQVTGAPRKEFLPAPSGGGGGGAGVEPSLSPATLRSMARQYWAGDRTVFQNLGRGAQGAANIVALREMVTTIGDEMGKTPEELARVVAQFEGVKSGFRSIGNRSARVLMGATEAGLMADIVLETSEAVDRTEYPDLNAIAQAVRKGTGDAAIARFNAALNSFVNVYSNAITTSASGATVSDKEHAREMLNTAFTKGQIEGTIDIMLREIEAAKASPKHVKERFGQDFMGTGGAGGHGNEDSKVPDWAR